MRALYWEQVDQYSMQHDPEIKANRLLVNNAPRRLKSDNPLIDHVWFLQFKGPDREVVYSFEALASETLEPIIDNSNGFPANIAINRFSIKVTKEQIESLDIPEAIEWINNLKE